MRFRALPCSRVYRRFLLPTVPMHRNSCPFRCSVTVVRSAKKARMYWLDYYSWHPLGLSLPVQWHHCCWLAWVTIATTAVVLYMPRHSLRDGLVRLGRHCCCHISNSFLGKLRQCGRSFDLSVFLRYVRLRNFCRKEETSSA